MRYVWWSVFMQFIATLYLSLVLHIICSKNKMPVAREGYMIFDGSQYRLNSEWPHSWFFSFIFSITWIFFRNFLCLGANIRNCMHDSVSNVVATNNYYLVSKACDDDKNRHQKECFFSRMDIPLAAQECPKTTKVMPWWS